MTIHRSLSRALEYQGFDPERMVGVLLSKWTAWSNNPASVVNARAISIVEVTGAKVVFTWCDGRSFREGMVFICMIFCIRGAA